MADGIVEVGEAAGAAEVVPETLDARGVAQVVRVMPKHIMDMVARGWLPAPLPKPLWPRVWDKAEVLAWAEAHREWVEATDPQVRRGLRAAATRSKSGPSGVAVEGRMTPGEALKAIRVSGYPSLWSLVRRGRFPEQGKDGCFAAADVAKWVAQNQDWINAESGGQRHRAGVWWPDPKPEEEEMDEEAEVLDEEDVAEDGEEEAEEGATAYSDPVAAIQAIAQEAIRAIRAITELQASGVEEEEAEAEAEDGEEDGGDGDEA